MHAMRMGLPGIRPVDEGVENVFSVVGKNNGGVNPNPFEELGILHREPDGVFLDFEHHFSLLTNLSQMPWAGTANSDMRQ